MKSFIKIITGSIIVMAVAPNSFFVVAGFTAAIVVISKFCFSDQENNTTR